MPTVLNGRYRLDVPIGTGGTGVVWQAEDHVLERAVAVKVIDLSTAVDGVAEDRFRREAMALARLQDPHVVSVFDAGADGGQLFLVMELLAGPSLVEVLQRHGPLDVPTVVGYGRQVLAGLAAAHRVGVVHRDLKPGNAVFSGDATLKLVDFGIAKVVADTTQVTLTAPSAVIGTPGYLSPEQIRGGTVDDRSDLYAAGCLLHALLTGSPPFVGATPLETIGQHLHAPPPDLLEQRPDVPPQLAATVRSLLAKDPARRPQTAAEAARMLAGAGRGWPGAASGLPTPTAPLPAKQEAVRRWPHRRWAALVAALVVLTAVVVAVVVGSTGGRGRPRPGPATTTTSSAPPLSSSTTQPTKTSVTTGPSGTTASVPPTVSSPQPTTPSPPGRGHGPKPGHGGGPGGA